MTNLGYVELGAFVIMPNHIHGILWIVETPSGTVGAVRAKNFSTPTIARRRMSSGTSKTISSIVQGFKIGVTKGARQNTDVHIVWQRNYYEHIIRH
jgi:REP element-mobilizing transposase RayT